MVEARRTTDAEPPGEGPREGSYASPAVTRAGAVLDELSRAHESQSLGQLSVATGVSKSSLHAILAAMSTAGLVSRVGTRGSYVLGPRVVEYAQAYLEYGGLRDRFIAAATPAATATGETIQLARLEGVDVVYLAKVAGPRPLQLPSAVGARLPASCTALGKALLATMTDAEVLRRYALDGRAMPALTRHSVDSLDGLLRDLRRARRRGYALDSEEAAIGLRCIGVPIMSLGEASFAVSCSFPAEPGSSGRIDELASTLAALKAAMLAGGPPLPG